ncbi:SDR family oxidoreductase [Pseudoflavonifractor capillosus]|uniref:SDR family oxidoreductase n=1 Tax=Pseudoflavonifractor capillosus TaxID=106588 RepID=UPI00195DC1B2|nr:SDR family oxidoreductase [Pseudoflavonifractor capillosus]MBM6680115.1 SDR family oxidoreductase [Pseudoflavonifractor capillosus]
MEFGLNGKVALVMASAAGLGKGIATELAREGAKVMICTAEPFKDQLYAAQDEIEQETGNRPEAFLADVNKADDIQKLVDHTVATLGDIWALVNMCPGPKPGPFDSFQDADWENAFNLCLLSYVRTIRACLPSMRKLGGGRIVNSTSSSVKDCLDNLILSNTMRMGVVGMSKTLSSELGKDNILINVIGPGRIGTARITSLNAMRAEKAGISVEEYEKEDLKSFPLGRYGTPTEYGRLAAFLCSEANTYISGQTILLDGGMTRAY